MRLKVSFGCEKLPILYRHRFMALVKEAIKRSNLAYKNKLYPEDNVESLKITKPFCFSVQLPSDKKGVIEDITIEPGLKISEMVFYIPSTKWISFYVSSSDYEFTVSLYNGLLKLKEFPFSDDITLKTKGVLVLKEKEITKGEAIFRTLSPILIQNKNNKPVLPYHDSLESFNEHFNAIHHRIFKDLRGEGLYKPLEFVPLDVKKQVVKHTLKGFRETTGKPYMTLTCFEGIFKLKGDPRDLQMLYQVGMGLRRGQGFGMVEVL